MLRIRLLRLPSEKEKSMIAKKDEQWAGHSTVDYTDLVVYQKNLTFTVLVLIQVHKLDNQCEISSFLKT